jgi:hypothetical protein
MGTAPPEKNPASGMQSLLSHWPQAFRGRDVKNSAVWKLINQQTGRAKKVGIVF